MIMMMVDIMLTWVTLKEGNTRAICKILKYKLFGDLWNIHYCSPKPWLKKMLQTFVQNEHFFLVMPEAPLKTSPDHRSLMYDGLQQISGRLVYIIPMPYKVWMSSQWRDLSMFCIQNQHYNDHELLYTTEAQTCSDKMTITMFCRGWEDAFCDLSPPSLSFISDALLPTIMTPEH